MKCLTLEEIEQWLWGHRVTPTPYGNAKSPTHYRQFHLPSGPIANFSFIRRFLKLTSGEFLIHITDWPTYELAEMIVLDSLRGKFNETRHLMDVPGHLVAVTDHELAIAIFGLTGNFEWSACLYLPNDMATLYNWEGELYDFWSNDEEMHHNVVKLIEQFGLTCENA